MSKMGKEESSKISLEDRAWKIIDTAMSAVLEGFFMNCKDKERVEKVTSLILTKLNAKYSKEKKK